MRVYYTLTLCAFIICRFAYGQHSAGSDLVGVLKQVEEKFHVSFSYDPELLSGMRVHLAPGELTLEQALSALADQTLLQFERVHQNSLLIKARTFSLCARVVDSESRDVLKGVHIFSVRESVGKTSDAQGRVTIEGKFTAKDTLAFKYLGYRLKKVPVSKLAAAPCADIALEFGYTTVLSEVVIDAYLVPGINAIPATHSLEIKTEDLALLPGETDGDVLLSLRVLPGITAPNGKAGNLHIRGSTTDQTLVLFDNIPIYHKGHYFGAISPFNPRVIDRIAVYRSGYEPRLGGRAGGAIELKTRRTVPDSAEYGVGINSYYGSAYVRVPVLKEKVAVTAAVRTSYPPSWQSPKLEAIDEMVFRPSTASLAEDNPNQDVSFAKFNFADINGNVTANLKDGQLSVSFLEILNERNSEFVNINNGERAREHIDLQNWGINALWTQLWSTNLTTTFSLMRSDYDYHSAITRIPADRPSFRPNVFQNTIEDLSLSAEAEYMPAPERGHVLGFGYTLNHQDVLSSSLRELPDTTIYVPEYGKGTLHSFFASYSTGSSRRFTFNGGVRVNYFSALQDLRVEPRVFLNYKAGRYLSLKSSGGLYSQYINQLVYFDFDDIRVENLSWHLSSDLLPVVKSRQVMVGAMLAKAPWTIDLELYGKRLTGLATRNPDMPNSFYTGRLEATGLDLLVKRNWGGLDAWASYTLSRSTMHFDSLNQLSFKTYYDQPHVVNIGGTLSWRRWTFSMGWSFASGVPDYFNSTFFPDAGPSMGPSPAEPVPAEENDGRFTSQHQLDIAAVYHFPEKKKRWNGSIGLSILNVYDHENLIDTSNYTLGRTTSVQSRYAIGLAPNLMLVVGF